jgi:hypothetical protein
LPVAERGQQAWVPDALERYATTGQTV